jgi:hypothetical protein
MVDELEPDPIKIEDDKQTTDGGPPGWMAFGVVALMVLGAMLAVVVIGLGVGIGRL